MADDSDDGRLLLVLPLPLHRRDGRWFIERQAANGLRLWLQHFPGITLAAPSSDEPVPASSTPIDRVPGGERIEVVPLPIAYTPGRFLKHLPATTRLLARHIDRSRHLHFAIAGLVGDWASVAAVIAIRHSRAYAVWTDHVESDVLAFQAQARRGWRRLYGRMMARATGYYERALIRRAALGLFHGLDCYAVYASLSPSPHLVHDIHLGRDAHIGAAELTAKCARAPGTVPRIVYAGRAHRDKGVYDWIEVLAAAAAAGAPFKAIWYGEGPELIEARTQVEKRGLVDLIVFPGNTSDHAALLAALREQDIFLFCHKTKESPRCLIEALVSGTPLVGYATDYSRDLIAVNGGGVLTPQHDIAALTAALTELLCDRTRLPDLMARAAADGEPFSDAAVFEHRSDLMKTLPLNEHRTGSLTMPLLSKLRHTWENKVEKPRRIKQWAELKDSFVHTTPSGHRYKLYPTEYVDRHIFVEGLYERRFLQGLKAFFRPVSGSVLLDIGANIGNHSVFLADVFKTVHSFEPVPKIADRLRDNLSLNGITNVTIHQLGLSNRDAVLHFAVNEEGNLGSTHIAAEPATALPLPVRIGDDYLASLGLDRIDLIKIDVESHEPEVFEGLRATIAKFRPVIVFEYHGHLSPPDHFDRIEVTLPGYVFTEHIHAPAEMSLAKLKWHLSDSGRNRLKQFTAPERRTYENILAFPNAEAMARFEQTSVAGEP